MRILAISFYYPPTMQAAGKRAHQFVEGMRAQGHEVTLLTADDKTRDPFGPMEAPKEKYAHCGRVAVHSIPDNHIKQVMDFYGEACALVNERSLQVVVTFGAPQSIHVLGMKVSKATGIPHVMDTDKPWALCDSVNFRFPGQALKSEALGHEVYHNATGVVCASPGLKQYICDHNPVEFAPKFTVFPTPVNMETFQRARKAKRLKTDDDPVEFLVSGEMSSLTQSPVIFLEAIARAILLHKIDPKKIKITLIGDMAVKGRKFSHSKLIGKCLEFDEHITFDSAVARMSNADVLVLMQGFESQFSMELGSVLISYMATGNFILNVGVRGDASCAVAAFDTGEFVDSTDVKAIYNKVLDIYNRREEVRNFHRAPGVDEKFSQLFSDKTFVQNYTKALQKVIACPQCAKIGN